MDNSYQGSYIETDRLFAFAASCARLNMPTGTSGGRVCAADFRKCCRDVTELHAMLERRYGCSAHIPTSCQWILDNAYLVKKEYIASSHELKGARLRSCGGGIMAHELCRSMLASGEGRITGERCRVFLEGFQSVTALTLTELQLIPTLLRCAITESIARICVSMRAESDTDKYSDALGRLFTSLRLIASLDWERLLDECNISGRILGQDPTGEFGQMDAQTRKEYLKRLEKLAAKRRLSQSELAKSLIDDAQREHKHIGFFLFSQRQRSASLYIGTNVLLPVFFSLLLGYRTGSAAAALLLFLPLWELTKSLTDYILLRLIKPVPVLRMDMTKGVPAQDRTLCVISTILEKDSVSRLEELRLASMQEGKELLFGILADLPPEKQEVCDYDEALVCSARREINRLNRRYGGGFYLFTRKRSFDGDGYSGHERKRGAIIELCKLICDRDSSLTVCGEEDALHYVQYIITLDSDTQIYPGALGELIGAAVHPLCKPVIDPRINTVTAGHAILHPRIETELGSASETDFALIFAPTGGSDPYGSLCSELYMDAFQNGGFPGKGIMDPRILLQCTGERFPEGRILSHDALEGAYLRGGYVGDTAFSDRFPSKPLSFYRRQHRWIRGDWQNLPWLLHRELSGLDRFRLFDSVRRSLLPPATLGAIVWGFFSRGIGLRLAGWAALLSLTSSLAFSLLSQLRVEHGRRIRRHTRVLSGLGGAIVSCFMRLWLLPFECYVNLSAIILALWRMLVSKRHLLQWQTASQSAKGASDFSSHVKAMWFPVMLGVLLMAFSPEVIGKASGFMWLFSPAAAWALSLPSFKGTELSRADREYLLECAGENWRYLEQYTTREDNFLPPDNCQEQPPVGTAHRTSPTNMGLAMAAATACGDMGIITREAALNYVNRMADTMTALFRFDGHFCNWYDTRTLRPLQPVYVSTVDSGNLYAGMLCAKRAAEEWGKPELADKLQKLMEPMDFSTLYDPTRGLFFICRDTVTGECKGGWYDLMASEAMLTSYIAVCRGDVPTKHWRRLSRAQLQKDGYRGLASWTGTMFEYLMPYLFLPLYRSSLLYESSRFCLYAQKKRVPHGIPWGISESAFASTDSAMSYRYKANGCDALALKRGQDDDLVVSPYASFLALCLDPTGAAANLRELEKLGMRGPMGFYEAIDFTPGRVRDSGGEKLRSYMAHHVSMSIIAAGNALCERSVADRFISEPMMRARRLLLQEQVPDSPEVIRRSSGDIPEKPGRVTNELWSIQGGSEDTQEHCCVLSNGLYSIMLTNRGDLSARLGNMTVYRGGTDIAMDGEAVFPEGITRWSFSENEGSFTAAKDASEYSMTVYPAGSITGERRVIGIEPGFSGRHILTLRFSPMLCRERDYLSHPAYWQLGMEDEEKDGILILRRLPRGAFEGAWMALLCSHMCQFSYEDGILSAAVPLNMTGGERLSVCFALAVAQEKEKAVEGARQILNEPAGFAMVSASALRLGINAQEIGAAMEMLPSILHPAFTGEYPKDRLWQFGISGDLPIILCPDEVREQIPVLRRFCLLLSCGVECELVFITREAGEYLQPMMRQISDELSRLGLDALIGASGGVFFVPEEYESVLRSRACFVVNELSLFSPLISPADGGKREKGSLPEHSFEDGEFRYYVNRSLPSRCWQNVLTNGSFGFIAADCGMGNMWYKNAREMRINTPPEDIHGTDGPEFAYVSVGGEHISLFAANDGRECTVSFIPGSASWEKEADGHKIKTAAFIPAGTDARVLLIQGGKGMRLHWGTRLTLGSADGNGVTVTEENGILTCRSRDSFLKDTELRIGFSGPAIWRYDYSPAAVSGEMILEDDAVLVAGCCREDEIINLCKLDYVNVLYDDTKARWKKLCGKLSTATPAPMLDRFISPWCVYQCIAGRIQGRSSLYQSGGAIGFRDQLQDSVNMMLISPAYAKEQIIECCRHQYREGDVMHWWHRHPDGDRGVRTRCSDDLLWLVWALCDYVNSTGDIGICRSRQPFLASRPLGKDEHDRYETPGFSRERGTVLDHARRALTCCEQRGFGDHGLPCIGSCDWNDAFDRIEGESVWMGWFLSIVAGSFAGLLDRLNEADAEHYRELSVRMGKAADQCFNGRWYLRAYFPDGEAIGDGERIDSLAQSFAALCPLSSPEKRQLALSAAYGRLLDREHGTVRLFDPPFGENERSPGYITGYGRGYRENGGQYTHGAIWLGIAMINAGRTEEGWEILKMLLPYNRDLSRYGAEPYVIAADIASARGHEGEGGWTWYTGSAGWYFRAISEYVFGMRLRGGRLTLSPALPKELTGSTVYWTDGRGAQHRIVYGAEGIKVDGRDYSGEEIG